MEDKIREYEKFIEEKTSENLGPIERVKVAEYHKEMVANFQHERLIHLIIMLFLEPMIFTKKVKLMTMNTSIMVYQRKKNFMNL